jgi:hypothetical protein
VPFFFLALSIYLVLPIRTASNPPLDWGNIESLEKFWWHVSGKQYRVWMFEGWSVARKQLAVFAENVSSEFSYPNWFFIGLGVMVSWRNRKRFLFLIILFTSCLLYSINYDIHDINSYFLLAFVSVALFLKAGLARTFNFFPEAWKREWVSIGLMSAAIAYQVYNNRSEVNASEDRLASSFVNESLEKLPPNALVFSGLWDFFVSPMYYVQMVEARRKDIVVIDKSLLQNRVWYFDQLQTNHPEVYGRSIKEISKFLVELEKFERGVPFQMERIQSTWNELLSSLVRANLSARPVFVDWRITQEFDQSVRRTPFGFFVQLSSDSGSLSPTYWKSQYANPKRPDDFSNDLKQYYSEMLIGNIGWLTLNHRDSLASAYLRDLRLLEPKYAAMFTRGEEKR